MHRIYTGFWTNLYWKRKKAIHTSMFTKPEPQQDTTNLWMPSDSPGASLIRKVLLCMPQSSWIDHLWTYLILTIEPKNENTCQLNPSFSYLRISCLTRVWFFFNASSRLRMAKCTLHRMQVLLGRWSESSQKHTLQMAIGIPSGSQRMEASPCYR